MNADPIDTHSSHLDLEDLIAGATGQAIGGRAMEHLATCDHCRTESKRWHLVADGVRGLAAAAPEAAPPARPGLAAPPVLTVHKRRAVLAGSAAAAILLIGGAAYGISTAVAGHAPPGTGTTALTAVNGCAGLEQADGTLEQVNGSSLVIKTVSGQPVTVTTTGSTLLGVAGPLLSDITDGARVSVTGTSSDGAIAADVVIIGSARHKRQAVPGIVTVQGAVSDASATGFTVVTSAGTRVPVTTSAGTVVAVKHASLGQLQIGDRTFAVGYAGPGGTLSAEGVTAVSQLPAGAQVSVKVSGCSPASVADALGALVTGG